MDLSLVLATAGLLMGLASLQMNKRYKEGTYEPGRFGRYVQSSPVPWVILGLVFLGTVAFGVLQVTRAESTAEVILVGLPLFIVVAFVVPAAVIFYRRWIRR